MNALRTIRVLVIIGVAGAAVGAGPFNTTDAANAEARAVAFLSEEVPAWSRDNGCFSCHNNGDAARALYVAARKGYRISAGALADTTAWVSQPSGWKENKGDPGFSDKRLANIQFAASLLTAFETGHFKDEKPLEEAAQLVAADQGPDGAWRIETENMPGSPITYGTHLATYMAMRTLRKANSTRAKDAVHRAEKWLSEAKPDSTTAAAVLLLATANDRSRSSRTRQGGLLTAIRSAQTRDGGWGPYPDSPPEPFDTAIVLLALNQRRESRGIMNAIRKSRNFLVATQNPDGSWPATTRPPGSNSYAQLVSTTAWALLALLETR